MATYTQTNRPMGVTTPLGADVLLLTGLSGQEGLSQLFQFDLELAAENGKDIAFDKLLGQPICVRLDVVGGGKRYFHGICVQVSQGSSDAFFTTYQMQIVPKIWVLSRKAQCRIFQQLAVPDILKKVLTGFDVSWEIQGTFDPRDYCVQYRETDLAFACRLMEEEGIWYYFKHSDSGHKMVVSNAATSHVALTGNVLYETIEGGQRPDDRIESWRKRQEIRSGKVTLWDYNFEIPAQNLAANKTILETVKAGGATLKLAVADNSNYELYDFPGAYAQRYDGVAPGGGDQASKLQKIFQDNARTVGIRMEEEALPSVLIEGSGNCRQLSSGYKFTLAINSNDKQAGYQKAEGQYVLTAISHFAKQNTYRGDNTAFEYQNNFTCIPAALPFRPARITPRPTVPGTQTAVVVGPSGEEIFTDKYGRVKVQFHWDRDGKNDANSSCWVRVATLWAGKQWGMIHIPRIGQEVIVAFEEGDPDQPIVVGSVYNADLMPPYTLPDNKTQCGVKSRSTLKGAADTFNELRFEDKKDSEEVYFHAEKDFNRVVENNDTLKVGFEKHDKGNQTIDIFNNQAITIGAGKDKADEGSRTDSVWNNETITIGAGKGQNKDGSQTITIWKDQTETLKTGNRTTTIEQGNDSLTVKTGNRTVEISTGNESLTVKTGNRTVEISTGNDSLTVKTGNLTTKVNAGAISMEAMQGIELKVGSNSIKIDQTGVTIKGMKVSVQGQVQVEVKGTIIQVSADAMLQLKGGVTMIG